MPIPPLKKRSYGFTNRPEPRETRAYGDLSSTKPPANQTKTNSNLPKKPGDENNKAPRWIRLVLVPPKIIIWLLSKLWVFISLLWRQRPRLSKQTKVELRKKILWGGIICAVISFLGMTIMVAWASKDLPDPDRLTDRKVAQSTKIYDRTGEHLLYEIFSEEKRTIVNLEQIPQNLIDGVIATEDTTFYEHRGVRPLSILRALVYGLLPGRRVAGTSTLTQQLVKNAILTNERRISRKIKEIILSIRLEQKYSKEQILQIYFNEIPYGSTNYGAEAAAQSYFGKHVKDLDLQESATLAGLPKSPTRYLNNPEALEQRRNFVLFRMFEEGYITEVEKNEAQGEEITLSRHFGEIQAPHFVLYVKELLVAQFGESLVDSGGLKVITTLDWDKQQTAEKVFEVKGTEVLEAAGANNLALVSIDPRTGQILAMIGSKNFENEEINGQFNVATLGKRQPGSSFKPIVYAAAFEKGYTAETVLFDALVNFAASGRDYMPRNYDLEERGPVTMRQALQGSLNIPAVKTLYLVGAKKGVEFAERLGYTTLGEGDFGLSLVLGGGEVKLLEHVSAYGVLANGGVKQPVVSILKVENSGGDILTEWKQQKGNRILAADIAALTSNILSDDAARAYVFGTGGILSLPGRPVAAKTGTTNNYVDAWTVGYTPSLVTGVWGGNTDNSPMTQGFGGSRVAAPVWNAFMKEAMAGTPIENFPAPPVNNAKKAVLRGSTDGGITLQINKVTGKRATSSTPEHLIVERSYIQPHSILHYLYKDDPRGSAPENPADDPQYSIWEASIQTWVANKKEEDPTWEVSFEEPPTDEDDEYSLELMPTLTVVYPAPGVTLSSRRIDTDIRVSSPRGVTRVIYHIDGRHISTVDTHPFNLNYFARDLESGEHTLTILVEDDIGNRLEESVSFVLSAGPITPGAYWKEGHLKLTKTDFPRAFFLDHVKLDQIEKINIYQQKFGEEKTLVSVISDFSDLFNNQISFSWSSYPGEGDWALIAETEAPGSVGATDRLDVLVQ